jgi:hypothetical protein
VQGFEQDADLLPPGQGVTTADHGVLVRRQTERRNRRPQPQGLVQDARNDVELHGRFVVRNAVARQQLVDLGIRPGQHVRVAQQQVEREREQAAGRLVSGDEERQDLVADVLVAQPFTGRRVARVEHQPEQVAHPGLPTGAALPDHLVDERLHGVDVRLVGAVLLSAQRGEEGQLARPHHGLDERVAHRLEERVQLLVLEGVEAVAEPGEGDRVQRQPGHVLRHHQVDTLVVLPFGDQLLRDLEHLREVRPHRPLTERRHQDAVGVSPARLVVPGGEESVAAEVPHMAQRRVDRLVEARFVRQFGHKVGVVDEGHDASAQPDLVDAFGVVPSQTGEVPARTVGRNLQRVANDGQAARGGDWPEIGQRSSSR